MAEQWIKEGRYAVKWTRLSCRNFRDNQARLQLPALAGCKQCKHENFGVFIGQPSGLRLGQRAA